MTRNASFTRKIIYLSAIAVLFLPLSLISAPAKNREQGGGLLSQMRRDERLSQAQIGKIDPASASMSLATLGMRGVAANLLWGQATKYKKTENWDGFKATLNQIAKLQPNFVSVWQYQAWNISYNVSVEFDDYRHRYHWVKKGVDYLLEGNEYNQNEPLLLWDTGWFFGHKMGRADEYRQFRKLFREDDDFHDILRSQGGVDFERTDSAEQASNLGPDGKPDNWKVAHEYFNRAQRAVDSGKRIKRLSMGYWDGTHRVIGKKEGALKGKNPLVFHSDPPKALINYADAIEEDGYLDEIGQLAWQNAGRNWDEYGDRTITSSFGVTLQLNDRERNARTVEQAAAKLDELVGDLRGKLAKERESKLTQAEREALAIPADDRNPDQQVLVMDAEQKLTVGPIDLANLADPSIRDEARDWAKKYVYAKEQVRVIDRYREIVNFVYWRDRCKAEQTKEMIEARKLVLKADEAFDDARLEDAQESFEKAWDLWAGIFDDYEVLIDDVEGELIFEAIERYQKLMGQLDQKFPPPGFKLNRLIEEFGDASMLTTSSEIKVEEAVESAAEGSDATATEDVEAVETTEDAETTTDETTEVESAATETSEETTVDPPVEASVPAEDVPAEDAAAEDAAAEEVVEEVIEEAVEVSGAASE